MELNEFEHDLFGLLTWFEPDAALPGVPDLRPYSLASRAALTLLKSSIFAEETPITAADVALYVWLHSAPLPEVTGCLWDGSWRVALPPLEAALTAEDLHAFAEYRTRTLSAIAASQLAIRPRPATKHAEEPPRDLVPPNDLAAKLTVISRNRGWSEEQILWRTWMPKALQIFYADRFWNGTWTVRPGRETTPEDYQDTVPDWLTPAPPPIDTAAPS